MALEERLRGWTGQSSPTEQEKQERTERMVREAIDAHPAFSDCKLDVYVKGSYANKTNVRSDSDVDVAVQCTEVEYWEEETPGSHKPSGAYTGEWTPGKLRKELKSALEQKFPDQVDSSGSTAFRIKSSTARVDADVVPCFNFSYYFTAGGCREGTKVFKKDGTALKNYPRQQLQKGNDKDKRTRGYFKQATRIMKRVENLMVLSGDHREVPSFFVECLLYNCPDRLFLRSTWSDTIQDLIAHIWQELQEDEPTTGSQRWLEVSECKYLFQSSQAWSRSDGRDFAQAAWNYLGYKS